MLIKGISQKVYHINRLHITKNSHGREKLQYILKRQPIQIAIAKENIFLFA